MCLYQSGFPYTDEQGVESSLFHILALIWYIQTLDICLSYECQIVFCFIFHFSDHYWGGVPFQTFFDNLDFLFCALPVDIFYLFLFSFLTFSYLLMGDI